MTTIPKGARLKIVCKRPDDGMLAHGRHCKTLAILPDGAEVPVHGLQTLQFRVDGRTKAATAVFTAIDVEIEADAVVGSAIDAARAENEALKRQLADLERRHSEALNRVSITLESDADPSRVAALVRDHPASK